MKVLTPFNFKEEVDKVLANKVRWNSTLDNELCASVLNNMYNPVLTQGIQVKQPTAIEVCGVQCTLYVLYNPYMVMGSGWSIAGCITDTVSNIVVFVDDDYMALSHNTQDFILWHEVGHISHRHVCTERNIQQEYEADLYAQSVYGYGVKALVEIRRIVPYAGKTEMVKRINHLKKARKDD